MIVYPFEVTGAAAEKTCAVGADLGDVERHINVNSCPFPGVKGCRISDNTTYRERYVKGLAKSLLGYCEKSLSP